MGEAAPEQAALDVYESPEQSAAGLDPDPHDDEWLPNNQNYHHATFGAFNTVGELVGCISLYEREDDGVGVLEGLYVRKSEREGGHARRLVRAALADAKDRGRATWDDTIPAIAFGYVGAYGFSVVLLEGWGGGSVRCAIVTPTLLLAGARIPARGSCPTTVSTSTPLSTKTRSIAN